MPVVLFFCIHSQGLWKSDYQYTERVKTQQDKINSRAREEPPTAWLKAKIVRLGQTMGVGRNGGQERMHEVDKMDIERKSQEGKLELWKEEGLGWS